MYSVISYIALRLRICPFQLFSLDRSFGSAMSGFGKGSKKNLLQFRPSLAIRGCWIIFGKLVAIKTQNTNQRPSLYIYIYMLFVTIYIYTYIYTHTHMLFVTMYIFTHTHTYIYIYTYQHDKSISNYAPWTTPTILV